MAVERGGGGDERDLIIVVSCLIVYIVREEVWREKTKVVIEKPVRHSDCFSCLFDCFYS